MQRLDKRLRLQTQLGFDGLPVWCVIYDGAGDQPPGLVLEWRDEDGMPIPEISWSIIDRLKAMENADGNVVERAIRANEEMVARKRREREAETAEIYREMIPMVEGRKRILAPRGQKLYQQRNRRRARGEI